MTIFNRKLHEKYLFYNLNIESFQQQPYCLLFHSSLHKGKLMRITCNYISLILSSFKILTEKFEIENRKFEKLTLENFSTFLQQNIKLKLNWSPLEYLALGYWIDMA